MPHQLSRWVLLAEGYITMAGCSRDSRVDRSALVCRGALVFVKYAWVYAGASYTGIVSGIIGRQSFQKSANKPPAREACLKDPANFPPNSSHGHARSIIIVTPMHSTPSWVQK